MRITIINPPLVSLKGDVLGSGVPYVPVSAAYLASFLRSKGHEVSFVDAFGDQPMQKKTIGKHLFQGLSKKQVLDRVDADTDHIFVYAGNVMQHNALLAIVQALSSRKTPITVFENTQAVTAYSLRRVAKEIFDAGAASIITGEAELRAETVLNGKKTDGVFTVKNGKIVGSQKKRYKTDLDNLPFPAWDLLPMEQYWKLGYAHGPLSAKRYLPILTSRGCPFPCGFCVVPETNEKRWRYRSAKNVVDEMEEYSRKFSVHEFHIEDLNPTLNRQRMIDISKEIIERKLNVTWKICAGTKIESLDKKTLVWMRRAGLDYLSFSPESGSPRVLKRMKKPFQHERALKLAGTMSKLGINTQACFVLGYPGEKEQDLAMTKEYALRLARKGVDEIALFIMTPIPGSSTYGKVKGYDSLSELTFSPQWRPDYQKLDSFRKRLYLRFFMHKLLRYPAKVLNHPINIVRRRFSIKTEMAAYRYLRAHVQ